MKYIPITQEVFRKLVGGKKLMCKSIPVKNPGLIGKSREDSFDYFLHPFSKVPFLAIGALGKYIYPVSSKDPLSDLIGSTEEIELDFSYWILERFGDLDNTFMLNSYHCFGVGSSREYETIPKYGDGIYELSLPLVGFTKKIWIKLNKYYDWSKWEVGVAYKNMFDCFSGTYYNMNLKQHYLNLVDTKLYELNSEKGC